MCNDRGETRRYYIDNLRGFAILLLIPFHAAMAFNNWGEGNYIYYGKNDIYSSFIFFVSPWYMSLLFVLAGISARLSLQKRTVSTFIKERLHKLFLPLIMGILVVVAPMTYFADCFNNNYQGNFLAHYSRFFTTWTDLTGYDGGFTPAHLWFLLYLFIISLVSLGLISLQKKCIPKLSCKGLNIWLIILLSLLPIILYPVLNIGGKSLVYFMALYLVGYYIFSEEAVIHKVYEFRCGLLVVFLGCSIFQVTFLSFCSGILTLLGFGSRMLNQNNRLTTYLRSRCFLIYIFHFIWLVIVDYYVYKVTTNAALLFIIPVLATYPLTFLTCEIVIRIPGIRFLFGVKGK